MKIASHSRDKPCDMMNAGNQHTTMTDWLGADCPVDYLNVVPCSLVANRLTGIAWT